MLIGLISIPFVIQAENPFGASKSAPPNFHRMPALLSEQKVIDGSPRDSALRGDRHSVYHKRRRNVFAGNICKRQLELHRLTLMPFAPPSEQHFRQPISHSMRMMNTHVAADTEGQQ